MVFSIMHTHVAWLSFSRMISIMFCELPLIYFPRLPERKLLSGGVVISLQWRRLPRHSAARIQIYLCSSMFFPPSLISETCNMLLVRRDNSKWPVESHELLIHIHCFSKVCSTALAHCIQVTHMLSWIKSYLTVPTHYLNRLWLIANYRHLRTRFSAILFNTENFH